MPISKFALAVYICLSFGATSCSTSRGYEYYLDKDETHRDVYNITASVHSDGTCSFAIGANESYEGLQWFNPEQIKEVDQHFRFRGICTDRSQQYPLKQPNDPSKYFSVPGLFFKVFIAENSDTAMLKSGISLDVFPIDTLVTHDSPPGVYFSIRRTRSVKKPARFVCSVGIDSLRGEAFLKYKSDGVVTLTISALGFAADQGCV